MMETTPDMVLVQMGRRIAQARKAKGYTQERLAELTGLSLQTISSAENGHKALRPENIIKLCTCLSVSSDYLLCGRSSRLNTVAESEKIDQLSPKQREALSKIIDDFLSAFEE